MSGDGTPQISGWGRTYGPGRERFAENLASKPANALAAIRRCLIDGGATDFESGMAIEHREAVVVRGDVLSHHRTEQIDVDEAGLVRIGLTLPEELP